MVILVGEQLDKLGLAAVLSRLTGIVLTEVKTKLQKGGDPTAGSPTVTLLRLHPSHQSLFRRLPPRLAHRLLEQLTPMV
jgi:hypothetical protein